MIGTFCWVTLASFRNQVRVRLRRLRQPRYVLSVVAALLYFGWLFLGSGNHSGVRIDGETLSVSGVVGLVVLSILATVLMIGVWALPKSDAGIAFSESEIHFLFPAPISRGQLLFYKVSRSQPGILFGLLMLKLFLFRHTYTIGLWIGLVCIDLYFLMASFGRARLAQLGIGILSRGCFVIVALSSIVWITAANLDMGLFTAFAHRAGDGPAGPNEVLSVLDGVAESLFSWPLSIVYGFPSLLARPAAASSAMALLGWSTVASALGIAFFFIAVKLDVSFEDASIIASQKKADKAEKKFATRRGSKVNFKRVPAFFRLAELGPPETAIVWKNFIAAGRITLPIFVLVVVGQGILALFLTMTQGVEDGLQVSGLMSIILLLVTTVAGPLIFRNDLRSDVERLDMIKLLPISGTRMVAAQVASPALIVFALQIVFVSVAAASFYPVEDLDRWMSFVLWIPAFFVAAIPLDILQILLQNAVVILLPAWAKLTKEESRGIEGMGRGLILMLGHALSHAVTLIPAALLFSVGLWLAGFVFDYGPAAGTIAVVPAAALLCVEILMIVTFLGNQFDEIDVANDLEAA